MRRSFVLTVTLAAGAGAPGAAQMLAGMPVWNSPKGGSGVAVAADYGMPSDEAGGGDAYGLRASLGLNQFTIVAGWSSFAPEGAADRSSSFGAGAAFRLMGGALSPLNLNLIGGASTTGNLPSTVGEIDVTSYYAGGGVSFLLPVPGFGIEPYLSVTSRWNSASGETRSDVGWTLGANVNLGMLGLHVAYDSQDRNGSTGSILGFGAHVAVGRPGL
jgi:hypothetical protein